MRFAFSTLFVLAASGLLVGSAVTQEPPAAQPAAAPPPKQAIHPQPTKLDLEVISLKSAGAEEMAKLLDKLFGDRVKSGLVRIVPDPNTNALLIQALPEHLEDIRAVLSKVDVARPEDPDKLSVFQLKNVEADDALQQALVVVCANRGFSLDRQRKMVIVQSDKRTAEAVETLLNRMEDRASRPPKADVQVRVVWLMNVPPPGPNDPTDLPPPPADLKGLLPDLAKLGFDRPRLAAQTMVNVTPGAQFRSAGRNTNGDPVTVSGRFTDKSGTPNLQLTIRATRQGMNGPEDLANIQTDITAPLGHLVVLGVTPTDTTTSVFIVQVMRPITVGR